MTKKNSGKAPSIQFYFKDWLADIKLKRISKAIKGVWIDLIAWSCCMPKMGVFFDGKESFSEQEIIDLLDGKQVENRRCFKMLIERDIIKKFDNGIYKDAFYVKRVYEDMKLRQIRKESGSKGGNPILVNDLVNQNDNQKPTPSTSSSISFSSSIDYLLKLNQRFASFYSYFESVFEIKTKRERGTFTKYAKLYAGLCSVDKQFNARMIDKLEDMKKDATGNPEALKKMFIASMNNEIEKMEAKP